MNVVLNVTKWLNIVVYLLANVTNVLYVIINCTHVQVQYLKKLELLYYYGSIPYTCLLLQRMVYLLMNYNVK